MLDLSCVFLSLCDGKKSLLIEATFYHFLILDNRCNTAPYYLLLAPAHEKLDQFVHEQESKGIPDADQPLIASE